MCPFHILRATKNVASLCSHIVTDALRFTVLLVVTSPVFSASTTRNANQHHSHVFCPPTSERDDAAAPYEKAQEPVSIVVATRKR